MEFCTGTPLTDVQGLRNSGVDLAAVSRIVTEMFSEQIFVHGFVHADPHPGNVLVALDGRGRPQVTLLDHGLYRELSTDFRLAYCRLWRSLLEGNADDIKEHAAYMNVGELYPLFAAMLTYKPWDDVVGTTELQQGRLDLSGSDAEKLLVRTNVAKYFREINALLARVPRDVLLLLKTNDCLHGLEAKLRAAVLDTNQPQLVKGTTHVIMANYCLQALLEADRSLEVSTGQTLHTWWRYYRDQCRLSVASWYMALVEGWARVCRLWLGVRGKQLN
jgi:aarF domain-containing kinase